MAESGNPVVLVSVVVIEEMVWNNPAGLSSTRIRNLSGEVARILARWTPTSPRTVSRRSCCGVELSRALDKIGSPPAPGNKRIESG